MLCLGFQLWLGVGKGEYEVERLGCVALCNGW